MSFLLCFTSSISVEATCVCACVCVKHSTDKGYIHTIYLKLHYRQTLAIAMMNILLNVNPLYCFFVYYLLLNNPGYIFKYAQHIFLIIP